MGAAIVATVAPWNGPPDTDPDVESVAELAKIFSKHLPFQSALFRLGSRVITKERGNDLILSSAGGRSDATAGQKTRAVNEQDGRPDSLITQYSIAADHRFSPV
jgi:hypothetical protein